MHGTQAYFIAICTQRGLNWGCLAMCYDFTHKIERVYLYSKKWRIETVEAMENIPERFFD